MDEDKNPDDQPFHADRARSRSGRSIVTEVGVFCIGVGLLIGVGGALLVAMGPAEPTLFRLPRNLVLGLPVVFVAMFNVLCGIFVLVVRNAATIVLCILAGAGVLVTYAGLMVVSGVGLSFNCISIVMIAIPAALFLRGREALAELSGRRTTARRKTMQERDVWRPRN